MLADTPAYKIEHLRECLECLKMNKCKGFLNATEDVDISLLGIMDENLHIRFIGNENAGNPNIDLIFAKETSILVLEKMIEEYDNAFKRISS